MKNKYKRHNHNQKENGEDFFYFPNIESLMKTADERNRGAEISTIVRNEKTQPSDRRSLLVDDNGMESLGIYKGDHVVIKREYTFYEGDIIAIRFEGKNLIRRLSHTKKQVILKSDQEKQPAMVFEKNSTSLNILGRVLQVIKELN
jgi:SOS-response transcriptional repressor LexA